MPPHNRRRARQPPKRVSTLLNSRCQSWSRSQRSTSGTPRYQSSRPPMGVANIWAQAPISSAGSLNLTKVDLTRFSQRPEKSEKMSIMVEKLCAATMDTWMKNVVSSAYCSKSMPLGILADWNPIRVPREHTCVVHTAKEFTTRMKSKGAMGQPCRMPH